MGVNDRAYVMAQVVLECACGSMVLNFLLCSFFALRAKNEHLNGQSAALPKGKKEINLN
jgi:hypothetical protein